MALLFGFGQKVDSDRPIAGALRRGSDGDAGLRVRHLPPAATEPAGVYARDGDRLVFTPPGIGSFRCTAHDIRVTPDIAADPDDVAALLIATAMPASLWMQGRFMLHAAALCLPGSRTAIAFAGPSGIGKSVIAAQLVARGAALLADDSVAVTPAIDGALASGLPGGYFEAIDGTAARRFVSLPESRSAPQAWLGAIIVISQTAGVSGITRLDRRAAIERILANRHRPAIPAALRLHAQGLAMATLLSAAIPVYAWQRPASAVTLDQADLTMLGEASR